MPGNMLPNFQPSRFISGSGVSISFDSALSVADDAAVSTVIAQASVSGQDGPHTFTLTDDASGQFAITTGGELSVAAALTAGAQSIGISATNGVDDPVTSAPSVSVNSLPVNTVAPSISAGVAGDEFTATPGTWTGFPTPVITGQWRLAGADIVGEDGLTYQSLVSDTGALVYRETATNVRDAVSEDSNSISLGVSADRAALVIGVGQSLIATRGSTVQSSAGALNSGAEMAVGGVSVTSFDFFSGNVEFPGNYDDWASLATFAESGTQSPMAGVTNTLSGYADMVLHTSAIGSRSIAVLNFIFHHPAAAIERGVKLLVASGYAKENIDIIFAIKHGEADAFAETSEAAYTARMENYIERLRLAARQALQRSDYIAPFHMSFPIQQYKQDFDRTIKKALLAIALADSKIYLGETWSVPVDTDRVHPLVEGYVYMGEKIGHELNEEFDPMRCTSVTLTNGGDSFEATFNKNVVRDTSNGKGTSLNAAAAEDGLEYHNGTGFVAISNLVYSGTTITGDLASTQTVGELRIAVQDTTQTVISGAEHQPGCFVRSDVAGYASIHNPSYTHYDWCISQVVEIS